MSWKRRHIIPAVCLINECRVKILSLSLALGFLTFSWSNFHFYFYISYFQVSPPRLINFLSVLVSAPFPLSLWKKKIAFWWSLKSFHYPLDSYPSQRAAWIILSMKLGHLFSSHFFSSFFFYPKVAKQVNEGKFLFKWS